MNARGAALLGSRSDLERATDASELLVTPAHLAVRVGRGRWRPYRHHRLLAALLTAVLMSPVPRFLMVEMPPRHGKSQLTSRYMPPWYLGLHPDELIMLVSYADEFAATWGREARNIMVEHGPDLFGLEVRDDSKSASRWGLKGHDGGMYAVGMGGQLTGRGGNVIVLDDPVKGWVEAQSEAYRENQWDWYQGTLRPRLEPGGSMFLVMTRWHEDDLGGKLLAQSALDPLADQWERIRLPAIAEGPVDEMGRPVSFDPEQWRDEIGRRAGEALWPEQWPEPALRQIEATVGPLVFGASFQQNPTARSGGMFDPQRWQVVHAIPHGSRFVRRWDLAATEKKPKADPDWTVGVLMARTPQGQTIVVDVVRFREEPAVTRRKVENVERQDMATWGDGRTRIPQRFVRDPAQAGKDQASSYMTDVLPAADAQFLPTETGRKEIRAEGFAAQQYAGNVALLYPPGRPASWQLAFIEEHRTFPRGKHDDQVDAAVGAFEYLTGGTQLTQETYERARRGR